MASSAQKRPVGVMYEVATYPASGLRFPLPRLRPYARRSALATFVSATSSVLRDVAMFIRIWPSPPNPYDVPALI